MNILLSFSRLVGNINKYVGNSLCYLVLFMVVTGVYEVYMRYFFGKPTIWVWELNGYLLCCYAALGGGYALLNQAHVKVDILYSRLSPRRKAIIDLCSSPFVFLFLGILLWQGTKLSLDSALSLEHSQTIFRPPIYPFKILLAIGIFLFFLQGLSDFLRNLCIALRLLEDEDPDGN
ncbi:MAG: TRAP transporter small permease [Deltaproteobacteria bacterium]|nr:MAG: TRAP transporter small permease [Deltaproteobacteria bacterium]